MKHVIVTMSRGDENRIAEWIEYHTQIGFDEFYIILDNPIDDTQSILSNLHTSANIIVDVRQPLDEYYDGMQPDERRKSILKWRESNKEKIKESGLPIVDPLSFRQYEYLPSVLGAYSQGEPAWVAVIDVDEFISLPGFEDILMVTQVATKPRVRFLNFNFDTSKWKPDTPILDSCVNRWDRDDIVNYGRGWEYRVKAIVRNDALLPLVSVHAISRGSFQILDHNEGKLHHYKTPDQGIAELPYSVKDDSLVNFLIRHPK